MKILPILAITALVHWSVTPAAQAAGDNAYKVNLVARSVHKNDAGRLVESVFTARDVVRACAEQNGLSRSELSLVYDLDADAVQVVRNTDGSVVCESFALDGGHSVSNASGNRTERLAFVFVGGPEAKGSSLISLVNRPWRPHLNVRGEFQYAVDEGGAVIISGFFSTGAKFVPTNPPPPTDPEPS